MYGLGFGVYGLRFREGVGFRVYLLPQTQKGPST